MIGAIYRFLQSALMLFPENVEGLLPHLPGGVIGMNALPSLAGVGYLVGVKIAGVMLGGGVLAWLVIIPLLSMAGDAGTASIFPATVPISELDAWGIWENYIQYIGAGVLTVGGIFEFLKALPIVKDSVRGIFAKKETVSDNARTNQDMSKKALLIIFLACVIAITLIPTFQINVLGALLVALFGFLFVSISSRIVGVVGSSSNPVSGMTIATIFFTSIIFQAVGFSGRAGMISAVVIGSLVTVAAATAGDISQDLKTGYMVGATPRLQQITELFAGIIFAGMSGFVLSMLHNAYTVGSPALPAPATSVIAVLVEGIFTGNLPWGLIIIGVVIGLICELIGIPSLPFAIGVYLPVHLTVPIYIGGLIRSFMEKRKKNIRHGTLFSSGLVAGDAIIGIIVAILTTLGVAEKIAIGGDFDSLHNWITVALMVIVFTLVYRSGNAVEE